MQTRWHNLSFCGGGTQIHIRQFKLADNGIIEVNSDGLTLSENQFAAFMYQMNAVEHSFMISNGNRQDNTSLFSDTV